jgi:glycosyltransferase involved in cell wall biosynthesis
MKILPRLRQLRQRLKQRISFPSKLQLIHWARQMRSKVKPAFVTYLGMKKYAGRRSYDPSRPTLLVVSHEASATGAPILAWNLCQYFSQKYNVIVMLLRGGSMIPDFQEYSIAVLGARREVVISEQLRRELHKLIGPAQPKVAIVNSIVSHPFIKPLRSLGIGVVSLIHEFPSSLRPAYLFTDIGIWSTRLIFSSDLTRNDLFHSFPQLQSARTAVFAQGPCKLPNRPGRIAAAQPSLAGLDAQEFLTGLHPSTLFVLAAGEVQQRKGVDLFIAVADQIRKMCPDLQIRFAWIGCGYDPLYDSHQSLWLQDQIFRSGLEDELWMLEHSSAYKDLLDRCDLFLMPSRLDPLPNVAVDALLAGKPVLCFENACGIANILLKDPELGSAWVSPYFDVHAMAIQGKEMLSNPELRSQLTHRSRQMAEKWFHMSTYCQHLSDIVDQTLADIEAEQNDVSQLMQANLIDLAYTAPQASNSPVLATTEFVLSWRQGVWPRKPLPGFHPGVYREQCLQDDRTHDPTLHFYQAGAPDGAWKAPLLVGTQSQAASVDPAKAALHIHVTSMDVLENILNMVGFNSLRPDIFVTSNDPSIEPILQAEHSKRGLTLKDHLIVPRRGRDLAAFLLAFLNRIGDSYEICGHVHTSYQYGLANSSPGLYQQFLLFNMVGISCYKMIDLIAAKFSQDHSLGLVFPADPVCFDSKASQRTVQALAKRLQIPTAPQWFDYPAGSMFWVRTKAMRCYQQLNLNWNDYPSDLLNQRELFVDAIQRTMPLVIENAGLKIVQTYLPEYSR